MAGIGFTLRRLTKQDNLTGVVQGYFYATFITSGPWIFTIITLAVINLAAERFLAFSQISLFRLIVIYNFSFTLCLTGPVVIIATRYLSDLIYRRDVSEGPGVLIGSLAVMYMVQTPIVLFYYGWYVDLAPLERLGAIWNYFLVAGIWLAGVFLSALKDYRGISTIFGVGMIFSFLFAAGLAPDFGVAGLLFGFDIGLAVVMFSLVSRILSEYPYPLVKPFAFLSYFRRYPLLALTGFVSNVALWVDKWIMWFAPEHERLAGHMYFFPGHDTAMFLAYITIIPALSIFVLQVETSFFEAYQRYFTDIQAHATFGRIRRRHREMASSLVEGFRNVIVLQGCLSLIAVLAAPRLFETLNLNFLTLGIFRFGVIGSFFQVLILFFSTILAYFDLRRQSLAVHAFFFVTNAGFTIMTMKMGPAYYGFGFLLATASSLLFAYIVTTINMHKLPYLTFVGNNPSVTGIGD